MDKNKETINNPVDAAVYNRISLFAIDQLTKMNEGTFKAEDYNAKLEDVVIEIRNMFMGLSEAGLL